MNNIFNSHKLIDGLTAIFYAIFTVLLLGLSILQASLFGSYAIIGAFLIFFALLFLIIFTDNLAKRQHTRQKSLYQLLAISVFAVFLAYISCCMTYALPSDTKIIYDSATALIEHGTLNIPYDYSVFYPNLGFSTLSDYYCRYPNNIAMLIVITTIYSIGAPLGFEPGTVSGQYFAVFITAISVTIAVHFLCKSAQYIFPMSVY